MKSKQISKIIGLTSFQRLNRVIKHANFKCNISIVSLIFPSNIFIVRIRRCAPNTNEQRSRNALCERVIRREATKTEGLVD